ncbi:class I SAM-dependent methyltransferase [Streptomyces sp. NBC_01565]|uniref:class I SAM-dependent methyltransferase n=1 Tax=unclassified Streptomyces TaxID=2593676 RepID=UPI00224D6535|nr:class I SAM-dependent methyltransferase [Streptomyces sp. NBC_01565]MCX4546108.1 methyltransferase domain-containing protein [Streptomyces sp. NBC_01565]
MAPVPEGHPGHAAGDPGAPGPGAGRYGEDLFRPEHPGEGDRIDHAAVVYDPFTRQRLRALGVGPGWRCLDVGAGTGTVARWLAEEAGADEVVALDRDTSRLAPLAGSRLRVRAADLTRLADEPDLGTFDLVHARFVLMHLPERGALVSRLAERLNPGGHLVLSDAADVPDPADTHSAYRRTLNAMWRALSETIGTDIAAVRAYPHTLREAGLADVAAELVCPPLTPGAPLTAFWGETWQRMRPDLLTAGRLEPAVLDEALAYLASADLAELGPGMLTAWGRRPAPQG